MNSFDELKDESFQEMEIVFHDVGENEDIELEKLKLENSDSDETITESVKEKFVYARRGPVRTRRKRRKHIHKPIKPIAKFKKHELTDLVNSVKYRRIENEKQKECKKCLSQMHPKVRSHWTLPGQIIKAVNECLLTRNWNALTYMLIELINLTCDVYKPIIRHVFSIMDKLHPVIIENNLQGAYKRIKKFHQVILDDTTVV
ncbi:unnamed protein product [Phyllotreta striolata]|uniref:Uncharacterized protein n=1 Tax=Phyllotreta striolata TaxID=444603 RepID=A0A9N9XJN2_PHYSR|nr:unnamed protein product [Phyllotreta striolata]